jgi:hypothetical protein
MKYDIQNHKLIWKDLINKLDGLEGIDKKLEEATHRLEELTNSADLRFK